MSETVILGSCEIWRETAHEMQAGTDDEVNTMIQEETRRIDGTDTEEELAVGADEDDEDGEVDEGKDD
jgi:hypothetical protein